MELSFFGWVLSCKAGVQGPFRMTDRSDWALVAQARNGDMAAFEALVRRYEKPIVGFCYRMIGSYQDAEDVAQESFVRLHRHIARLRPDAKFSTVLFGIARNLSLNFLRDARRRGSAITDSLTQPDGKDRNLVDSARDPAQEARVQEIATKLEEALGRLSPEHREVLVLREMHGMDYETIAAIVHCRKGTVKSRIARAREQLRQQLKALGGYGL